MESAQRSLQLRDPGLGHLGAGLRGFPHGQRFGMCGLFVFQRRGGGFQFRLRLRVPGGRGGPILRPFVLAQIVRAVVAMHFFGMERATAIGTVGGGRGSCDRIWRPFASRGLRKGGVDAVC